MTSSLIIDRPPIVTTPPAPPPPLTPPERRRRDGKPIIMPDIRHTHIHRTQHDNCWTIHHFWMNRVWGFFERVDVATITTRRYRQWLETHEMKDGIPPHIQFGGAVVPTPGNPDPTFYDRWADYARRTFC